MPITIKVYVTDWPSALDGNDIPGFAIGKPCGLSHLSVSINRNFIEETDN